MPRSFDEECNFVERVSNVKFRIKEDFVPNMQVYRCLVVLLTDVHSSGGGLLLRESESREAYV